MRPLNQTFWHDVNTEIDFSAVTHWCRWLLIATTHQHPCLLRGPYQPHHHVLRHSLQWWFPGPEWGQPYWFCARLHSIIKPLSRQPGRLWLSDFLLYKLIGKQPPNSAIMKVSVSMCSDTWTAFNGLFSSTHTHTCKLVLFSGIADCRS